MQHSVIQEAVQGTRKGTVLWHGSQLDGWADKIVAFWDLPLLRSSWAHAALWLAIASICAARASIGLGSMQMFSHDAFMPLDGAWRLLNGQRPHIDFYSFIGVLAYAPTALGLLLSHGGSEAFGYAQALQSLGLGAWAYVLARKRLPDVPAVLFTLAITLLAAAPFALGYAPLEVSPATTYNRYGYAALALVMLEAFAQRKRSDFWGGVSTGSLLVLLFFLKASYFAGAVLLVITLFPCRVQTRRRWLGLGAGMAALSVPFLAYFGFSLMSMFRDLAMVAGAKRVHLRAYLFDSIFADATAILCFCAMTALVLVSGRRARAARATMIAGVAVCLISLILIFGNCEPHGLPLCLSVFTVSTLTPTLLAFGNALTEKSPERDYQAFVQDGIHLLELHRAPSDSVMSLDFTNPFSFALRMKPVRGGTTALQYQTTFNNGHRPAAEWLFGLTQLVMVPKTFSDGTLQESIPRLYGPYLESHFAMVGESAQWRLYRALNR